MPLLVETPFGVEEDNCDEVVNEASDLPSSPVAVLSPTYSTQSPVNISRQEPPEDCPQIEKPIMSETGTTGQSYVPFETESTIIVKKESGSEIPNMVLDDIEVIDLASTSSSSGTTANTTILGKVPTYLFNLYKRVNCRKELLCNDYY